MILFYCCESTRRALIELPADVLPQLGSARNRCQRMKPFVWREYPDAVATQASLLTAHQRERQMKFKWHMHDDHYEILLPLFALGECMIGDYRSPLQAREIYLLGPGLPHSFYTVLMPRPSRPNACQCLTIRFSRKFLDQLSTVLPETRGLIDLQRNATRGILYPSRIARPLTQQIEALVARGNDGQLTTVCLLLQLLESMAMCSKHALLASPGYTEAPHVVSDTSRIDRICHYLLAHFHGPIRLAEVAADVGMSISNLCALFHKTTGCSIITYVNQIRIGHACKLLRETDQSILEIAFATGYQNLSHFNRQFRRLKGMAPRQFRTA